MVWHFRSFYRPGQVISFVVFSSFSCGHTARLGAQGGVQAHRGRRVHGRDPEEPEREDPAAQPARPREGDAEEGHAEYEVQVEVVSVDQGMVLFPA